MKRDDLIFDWNKQDLSVRTSTRPLTFNDETLRDGLQSPSVRIPSCDEKVQLLRLMAEVGIAGADVGLPCSSAAVAADAEALCREIVAARLPIAPNCAARTREGDVTPILEIAQRVGAPIEVAMFIGSSPVRRMVEGWSLDELARRTERCVAFATRHSAPVTFVTEDTTRSRPADLARLYRVALDAGATRVCIADTAGHVTPAGAAAIVSFVRKMLVDLGREDAGIDWHGHNDRGLAVANALAAAAAGADRIHATALGIGERVGNPPMEQLLVNARLMGWAEPGVEALRGYVANAASILGVEIPAGAPIVGRDAFRTTTGVHAAALRKAELLGEADLVDLVYSAVPAGWLGRTQEIEIGPMSGLANARSWLAARGLADAEGLAERIVAAAKRATRVLTDDEIFTIVHQE